MSKGKKRKHGDEEYEFDPTPRHLSAPKHLTNQEKRLIIILEKAQLETVKAGLGYDLLNSDDHKAILKKDDRPANSCRPDIVHQCLLMLMDSPLNRAGLLQCIVLTPHLVRTEEGVVDTTRCRIQYPDFINEQESSLKVYVKTEKNVLIEINPQTRIPRTFKRFAGLMVQLLFKFNVRASNGGMKLLKAIKNPVTDHLPVGCRKIGTSFSSKTVVNPRDIVPPNEPVALVVGAMAHGQATPDYVEDTISISNYPLSAALTCAKICSAFEEVWGIEKLAIDK